MSIDTNVSRNDYVGAGNLDTYNYGFKIFQSSDLLVTVRDLDDLETTLILDTDYTVSGVNEDAGGSIVLLAGNLTTGYALTVRRVPSLVQDTDLRNQGPYFQEVVENTFDKQMMVDQKQQDEIDRSLKFSETDASTGAIPNSADRASKFLGFDASGIPIAVDGMASVPVSPFMATVLDDLNAAAARATLGQNQTVDIADGAVTEVKLDDDSVSTAKIQDDAVTSDKIPDNEIGPEKLTAAVFSSSSSDIKNIGISASVAANALTIALKTKAGADPSASDVVAIGMRSSTITSGVYNSRTVTAALSLVISSGSTLGSTSGDENLIYVYLIDNAGTLELAASSIKFDEGSLVSTTAEGGAGAADSKYVMYSATARSNVPCRLIGRIRSTQATAGTYVTAPSEISVVPLDTAFSPSEVYVYAGNGAGSTNTFVRRWVTVGVNIGDSITYADSASDGGSFTINKDGLYCIFYEELTSGTNYPSITVNSTTLTSAPSLATTESTIVELATGGSLNGGVCTFLNLYAGDVVRAQFTATNYLDGTLTNVKFNSFRIVRVK